MKINAILMASGLSKRMGENKLFLDFKGKKIYETTLDLLKDLQDSGAISRVIVASTYTEILEESGKRGFLPIYNANNEIGKSSSIKLGIDGAQEDAALMFFVADQPMLTKETCLKLIGAFKENPVMTFPVVGRRRGAPVIFPDEYRDRLYNLVEDQGGMIFAKDNETAKIEIEDVRELADIDTVESYKSLKKEEDKGGVANEKSDFSEDFSHINRNLVIVRGGGDVATGSIQKLNRSGFDVLVLEVEKPTCIRRKVCAAQAVYDGQVTVEDIEVKKCDTVDEIRETLAEGRVAVTVDPEGQLIKKLRPLAVVDGILAKKNLGTNMDMAPITIGLGPGFTAGSDCNVVIETDRGHDLGRLIFQGKASANTGNPGNILGFTTERILRASDDGIIKVIEDITSEVKKGQVVAEVNGKHIKAGLDGMVRGMIKDGSRVFKGMKIGDVDPRVVPRNASTISDKARLIGGGTLEAVLIFKKKLGL